MLKALKNDIVYDDVLYLGLCNAPAAKANHHAYLGGLVDHYLEMWSIFKDLDPSILNDDILITSARVFEGIILHDLHKAWAHFVHDVSVPSGLNYGKHPSSNLLTQDQKSVYIASRYVELDIIQLNSVYHSEGGWAASPPRWGSALSKLLYLLDELSSNVKTRTLSGYENSGVVPVFGDKGVTTLLKPDFELIV